MSQSGSQSRVLRYRTARQSHVKSRSPRLRTFQDRADVIRRWIEANVRRAPQVMVKVTGGGCGMKAIAAHFRFISNNGRLPIEGDRGMVEKGPMR